MAWCWCNATEGKPQNVIANAKKVVMKRHILLIFTIIFFSINGYCQACGGGILSLNIYTKNGEKQKEISYEIFPVSKETFENYKARGQYHGIINKFSEQEISQNEDLDNQLSKFLEVSKISKSGKIFDCLKFQTFELVYFPVIIKISIEDKTVYILGNYFGGCGGEANLIFNGHYFKLI